MLKLIDQIVSCFIVSLTMDSQIQWNFDYPAGKNRLIGRTKKFQYISQKADNGGSAVHAYTDCMF